MTNTNTEQRTTVSLDNSAALFRCSGLIDALRDGLVPLLDLPTDTSAVSSAVEQYNKLRGQLLTVIGTDGFDEICTWTAHLDEDTTLQTLYLACVSLARVVDVVHQTPEFLLSQQVREVNAGEVRAQIENARPRPAVNSSILHFGIGD